MIYLGVFLFACERSFEKTSDFALNFGCFQVADREIHFVDFLQIEAGYTTFSYLLIPNNGQDMRESDFLTVAAKFRFCSIFIDINAIDYYMKPKRFLLSTSCLNWIPISFVITTFTYIFSSFCAPSQITLGLKVFKELELTFLKSLEIWSVIKGKSSHILLNSNKFF